MILNGIKFKRKKEISFFSYTCSSATFLENILIELGIRLRFEEELDAKNIFVENGFFIKKKILNEMYSEYIKTNLLIPPSFGLPSLTKSENFLFRNDLEVFFTHNNSFFNRNSKSFILIRDPRDTLLSCFRMNNYSNAHDDFAIFCQSHINNWVNFYAEALSRKNFYIIRFEDLKKTPIITLKNLFIFLDLNYEIEDLINAIKASSFEAAKNAEDLMIERYPEIAKNFFPNRITKSGNCFQYKSEVNRHLFDVFLFIERHCFDVLKKIGYQTSVNV